MAQTQIPSPLKSRIAVIGLGVAGITSVKNLVEQGFEDVTGFERNQHIGGLWQYNTDPKQTTALKTTRSNGSKQFSSYQDFPFPDDAPDYPSAAQVADYLNAYARHFDIEKHFRLGTKIVHIGPGPTTTASAPASATTSASSEQSDLKHKTGGSNASDGPTTWIIRIQDDKGEREEVFDKVLVTNGPWGRTYIPNVEGQMGFKGQILHAQAYKGLFCSPESFKDKRVVIVGLGNTGGDIAVSLVGTAAKVYVSHRSGARVMQRYAKPGGAPFDHRLTRRRWITGAALNARFPIFLDWLGTKIQEYMFKRANPKYKPEWGFYPAPPIASSAAAMQDDLTQFMVDGKLHNLFGIKRFTATGEGIVTHTRDKQGEVETPCDAVIFSTGYSPDLSFCSPEANPYAFSTPEWDELGAGNNKVEYPYLYQTLFHPSHADSLAFIGPCRGFSAIAYSNCDSSAQAIAQVWKGAYPLPSARERLTWCDETYQRNLALAKRYRNTRTGMDPLKFERWLNEVIGNRCTYMFGWGWEAWKFWWSDRRLYGLIMDGVNTSHVYRLWEADKPGSRKRWDGARDAIFKANGLEPPTK